MDPRTADLTTVALWEGGTAVRLAEVPLPDLMPGEVLVRVRLATVCGSDRHTVTGRRRSPAPSVLGHEAVGEVVGLGPDGARSVDGRPLRPGDRVVPGVAVACGACDRCLAGRTAKCRAVRKVGHESFESEWALSGTYARHLVLPAGATLARVPARLPDELAAPAACATATVMAVVEAAGPLAGRRVLVSGAGMLGITAVAAARDAGAAEVVVTDPDPARRGLALRFGATSARAVDEPVGLVDVAIELSGASPAVARCLDVLDVGGRLVLAGSVAPAPAVAVDPERVVRGWLTVTGVHNYEPRHLGAALDLLDRTRDVVPWRELVSAPVPLDALGDVLAGSPGTAPRVAVRP
ncbi:zinc-binding dehydrogenase [Cellulosimicrobium protaetiae]|uniref:Alcohol dehydrogenase catalytic domain-containing protein n=1 Tax=Cellulosimicrobium protaetiae TaxID=2587808 RepID=A0A6M5U977_9MICO|nr:zinc-binding dehydrogenase [Cellulosimicrobium protaetiae]QJW35046.1 alcohol dehydrogenase catalytic domain-containing protein [Cellulosimicrobium protaetiae]